MTDVRITVKKGPKHKKVIISTFGGKVTSEVDAE